MLAPARATMTVRIDFMNSLLGFVFAFMKLRS
jgi:hypothetical protein